MYKYDVEKMTKQCWIYV